MRRGLFKSASSAGRPKTESSIRGRISGPIPIPNPADDDEFPMRQPGTGLATPLNEFGNKLPAPTEGSSIIIESHPTGLSPPDLVIPEEMTESTTIQATPSQASSPAQRRTNRSSTLRYSTISAGTAVTSQPETNHQHKKSGIRSALGKLFGRKKRDPAKSSICESNLENGRGSIQYLNATQNRAFVKESEPKRSASLPITEYDRALRSHSVGPNDMVAIESARNSMQLEPVRNRRRAATTSSGKAYNLRSRDFMDLQGLSPRPASAHGRSNEEVHNGEDPEDIGRAITSDVLREHRRSRSLSQLHDTGIAQGQVARNRREEIRYWRESYDPGFMSPTLSAINAGSEAVNADVDDEAEASAANELKPKTPPQPFNFAPILGMKITEAAGLEERLFTLETRNQKLEKLVTQLFQVVPGIDEYPDSPEVAAAPRLPPLPPSSVTYAASSSVANPTLYQTTSNDLPSSTRCGESRHSNESFGEGHTFIDSVDPSTRPTNNNHNHNTTNRPTSTATVRGVASLPTLPRESSPNFNSDQYTTLLALIDTERSARQALEAQVTKLSNKLNLISRTSQKLEALTAPTGPAYSAFEHDESEDEFHSESEAWKTPREEQPQHSFGAFGEELKDEEVDGSRKRAARTLSLSQLTLGKPQNAGVGVDL